MTSQQRPAGRVLRNIRHGTQILPNDAPGAEPTTDRLDRVSLLRSVVPEGDLEGQKLAEVSTPFDHLRRPGGTVPGPALARGLAAVTAALKKLGEALAEPAPPRGEELQPAGNSTIPPVYTYWGQFIDHDITANTDRQNPSPTSPSTTSGRWSPRWSSATCAPAPAGPGPGLGVWRRPHPRGRTGDGRGRHVRRHQAAAVGVAKGDGIPGGHIPTLGDDLRDLPRDSEAERPEDRTVALIGDGRNDENLIVAQFHVAFLRFHNAVVEWVLNNMVRGFYDHNRNFGRKAGGRHPVRPLPAHLRLHRLGPPGPLQRRRHPHPAVQLGHRVEPVRRQGRQPARPLRPQDRHPADAAAVRRPRVLPQPGRRLEPRAGRAPARR